MAEVVEACEKGWPDRCGRSRSQAHPQRLVGEVGAERSKGEDRYQT